MQHEYEAKYLNIDIEKLRKKITDLGGKQIYPRRLFKRYVFESDILKENRAWLRVRDEGESITMTLKKTTGTGDIEGTQELEIEVSNMHDTVEMLKNFGLEQKRYQENYREKWALGDVILDIDTWPQIPTYIEIEGYTEKAVKKASQELGFDYEDARFGSADEIYLNEYGIDILKMDELLFEAPNE